MSPDYYGNALPIEVQGSATSYFSRPEDRLDPELFSGNILRPNIRNGLLRVLFDFLNEKYMHPDLWCHVWLAGSGISFQWAANREPGDLDILIGVNYVQFRKAHPQYNGLADSQVAALLNEDFRKNLQPETTNWNGFEVTFYVNATATDIRTINPYAAYDLTHNEWTVYPSKEGAPQNKVWDESARRDHSKAVEVVTRYAKALDDVRNASSDAKRRNAEFQLKQAIIQGSALYTDIHNGRRLAFSPTGQGYADFHNYRWQSGKKLGTVTALRKMYEYHKESERSQELETYGVELPDVKTMVRRAALYRNTL